MPVPPSSPAPLPAFDAIAPSVPALEVDVDVAARNAGVLAYLLPAGPLRELVRHVLRAATYRNHGRADDPAIAREMTAALDAVGQLLRERDRRVSPGLITRLTFPLLRLAARSARDGRN